MEKIKKHHLLRNGSYLGEPSERIDKKMNGKNKTKIICLVLETPSLNKSCSILYLNRP